MYVGVLACYVHGAMAPCIMRVIMRVRVRVRAIDLHEFIYFFRRPFAQARCVCARRTPALGSLHVRFAPLQY